MSSDNDAPSVIPFNWIGPLFSFFQLRKLFFGDLPPGMSGDAVFRALKEGGAGPSHITFDSSPRSESFVVAVKNKRRAKEILDRLWGKS